MCMHGGLRSKCTNTVYLLVETVHLFIFYFTRGISLPMYIDIREDTIVSLQTCTVTVLYT